MLTESRGPAPTWAGDQWAIVTAHNPGGRRAPDDQNAAHAARLAAEIARTGRVSLAVVNGSGDWAEPARLVWGARLAEAVTWGRAYGQAAVLWASGARVALVWLGPSGVLIERFWACGELAGRL